MEIGTKVHQILEEIDFNNPEIDSLDIDDFLKNKIKKFLDNKIIKDSLNGKIYKEYEFVDNSEDEIKRGIIDLLIEKEDEIIIIDYKLNDVLDEAYKKQLNGYKDEISKIKEKRISIYLYSIIGENFEEIKQFIKKYSFCIFGLKYVIKTTNYLGEICSFLFVFISNF